MSSFKREFSIELPTGEVLNLEYFYNPKYSEIYTPENSLNEESSKESFEHSCENTNTSEHTSEKSDSSDNSYSETSSSSECYIKFVPEETNSVAIRCQNINVFSQQLFKTICDIIGIEAISYYEKYREIEKPDEYCIEIDDYDLYFDLKKFLFAINSKSKYWNKINSIEENIDELILALKSKFIENINFHINEDELLTKPILIVKEVNNSHVIIKETTYETLNNMLEQCDEFDYTHYILFETIHINKTDHSPYIEYEIFDDFDIYEDWPFRKPLSELILEKITNCVNDFTQPFKISFKNMLCPTDAMIYGGFINILQDVDNGKLSIDMVFDIDDEKRILIQISKEQLETAIRSINYDDIRYNSKRLNVYYADEGILRERIVEALIPYKVEHYEIQPYDQQEFEETKNELSKMISY